MLPNRPLVPSSALELFQNIQGQLLVWKESGARSLKRGRWWIRQSKILTYHYYRNANLSRLGNPCCPGFPTGNARPGQKGGSFCPGSGNRDKRVRQPQKVFFSVFIFSILFLFQLYFCISIKPMYWNSVCTISTNIYIYIYRYLYNICPR